MALVKVKQFFMSNENIAEEKRGSMYALYMTEVYAGKASKPQMIKGVGYAEEADLLSCRCFTNSTRRLRRERFGATPKAAS